jgi:hypothetical protein
MKLNLRGKRRWERPRKEWEQYIGKIARDNGIKNYQENGRGSTPVHKIDKWPDAEKQQVKNKKMI